MKTVLHLGNRPVTLETRDFDDNVDVDALTKIDHSNLYGEAVTVPALLNHVGLLKAEVQNAYDLKKLECEVYEAELRQSIRKSAVASAEKLTESSINEKVDMDGAVQIKRKALINAKHNLEIADSLYWSVKSKDQKLNNLVTGVTQEELFDELVEGTVNNIIIRKRKSIVDQRK